VNPDVSLCAHLGSLALESLPIAPADILEWRDAPVLAIARCDSCERLGLLELVGWDHEKNVRTYSLAGLDPKPLAVFLRDLARGSCDPARLAKEGESLLASAGPVARRVSLDENGAVLKIERSHS